MENRKYNIFFHLHTVSGIAISVVLFVIFFAGSFSFFRDDINNWQHNCNAKPDEYLYGDFNRAIKVIDSAFVMQGRTFELSRPYAENMIVAHMDPTKDSLADKKARIHEYVYVDTNSYRFKDYYEGYSLGEFIYRLHFLAQIPYPYGYYLAGFTALFFLFAIITGVLVHWKKIVSNFYTFRPKEKLKTMWTDAHTGLGMIGMPFQFVYALTGAFFLINIFLVAPSVMTLYDNDSEKLYQELGFMNMQTEFANKRIEPTLDINALAKRVTDQFKDFNVTALEIQHYGDANMQVTVRGSIPRTEKFTGFGKVVFNANGKIIAKKNPYAETSYLDGTRDFLYRIHYGDYGGYALKIASFVLGLISCFVILSGVMLWLVARDKKKTDPKKKRFNAMVVRIYLSICLSMFPVTAATFIAVKLYADAGIYFLYSFYFIGWLLLSIVFFAKKDFAWMNRWGLLLGAIGGILIPIVNGLTTGNWIWRSLANEMFSVFFVDVLWTALALAAAFALWKIRPSTK